MRPERVHADRRRAESFGAAAELYDRARPSYPAALIDAMLANGPGSAVDVGCGTGKLARLLLGRGVDVLGIEVDGQMATVARAHGVRVEVTAFETWDARGRAFDLLVSGQAWHWIDPVAGPRQAADVLRPGGTLVLAWNHERLDPQVRAALDRAYDNVGMGDVRSTRPALAHNSGAGLDRFVADLRTAGGFGDIERREFGWERTYTTDEWIELVRTHSEYLTLDEPRRAELETGIRAAIDALGSVLSAPYLTHAIFARRAGRGTLACVELLTLDQVAERLRVSVPRVQQHLRDGQLIAVEGRVPADCLQDGSIAKGLPAVITLLRDARYSDAEIVDWLTRDDPSLPGRAIDALRENRGREVKRRAQAAGF